MKMKSVNMKYVWLSILAVLFLTGCQRQTVVTFTRPNVKSGKVKLVAGGKDVVSAFDSTGCARFVLDKPEAGYAYLDFGNGRRKTLFVEPGKNLDVTLARGKGGNIYSYEGEGAPENRYLEEHQRACFLNFKGMSEDAALKTLDEEEAKVVASVDSMSLSPDFIRLERERQRYGVLRRFAAIRGYKDWSEAIYPYLKSKIKEWPELLEEQNYSGFLADALFMIGTEQDRQYTPHGIAQGQLAYIASALKNPLVKDVLLKPVMINYLKTEGVDASGDLMDVFNAQVTSAEVKAEVQAEYDKWAKVAKGKELPAFTFEDLQGKDVSLAQFRGKYVLIDCWATWCGPCRGQLPALKKLEEEYAGKALAFVSISSDSDKEAWKKFVEKEKLGGVQLIQKTDDWAFSNHFVITGIPRFILLDKEGKVYDANAPRPSDPALKKLLEGLL